MGGIMTDSSYVDVKSVIYTESLISIIKKESVKNRILIESASSEADSMLNDKVTSDSLSKLYEIINTVLSSDNAKLYAKQKMITDYISTHELSSDPVTVVALYKVIDSVEVVTNDMNSVLSEVDGTSGMSNKIDMCKASINFFKSLIADSKKSLKDIEPLIGYSDIYENIGTNDILNRIQSLCIRGIFTNIQDKLKNTIPARDNYNYSLIAMWSAVYFDYLNTLKNAIVRLVDYYWNIVSSMYSKEKNMKSTDVIENVFDPINFEHGFLTFEESVKTDVSNFEVTTETVADIAAKVKSVISTILAKIKQFYIQLRAKIVAKYNGAKFKASLKKIDKAIDENPQLLRTKVECVDYDKLIKECDEAKKALENRMNAYIKVYNNNKELIEKENFTPEEAKRFEAVDKQLREIAYGEGKWSKKKVVGIVAGTAAATVVITGVALYAKYKTVVFSIDKDLSSRAADSKTLDMFKNQVGVSTRTSGYTLSIAEEYAKVLSMQGKLAVSQVGEVASKLISIISSGVGSGVVSNAKSVLVSGAKYLESTDEPDNLLMSIFEEMTTEEVSDDTDESFTDSSNTEKNEAPVDKVDNDVSEEADDYDPMRGLF